MSTLVLILQVKEGKLEKIKGSRKKEGMKEEMSEHGVNDHSLTFLALCMRKMAMCRYNWPTISWPNMVLGPTTCRCALRFWSNLKSDKQKCVKLV